MASPDIVILSDGDSDNDVAFVGARAKTSRVSTSPVFLRASKSAEVYTLEDTDGESDGDDLTSILAGASTLSTRRKRDTSFTIAHDSSATTTLHTARRSCSTTVSSTIFRQHLSVSSSRSILSVLEGDWDNELTPAPSETVSDATKPQKKRRKTEKAEGDATRAKSVENDLAREERERLKQQEKEERERLREREKEERQRARDEAKAAKEAERSYQRKLKEVNRLRKTKSEALREVEIHMAHDLFEPTSPIAGALPEIRRRVEDSQSKLVTVPESETIVGGTIRFLRHVTAEWDATSKRYIPLDDARTEWETTTILVASADEIVDRVIRGGNELIEWIADVRLTLFLAPDEQLLLLVRGLEKYHAKTRSIANKAFRESALAGLATGRATSTEAAGLRSRLDKEEVEAELLKAQLSQYLLVVQVEKTEDIEDWLFNLAGDIAAKPYKLLEKSHLPFSAPDHPRKAVEPRPVLELMLQEVNGLTASAASGITARYPSFRALMQAYDRVDVPAGEALLMNCEIRNSKNGAAASRRVGPALSRKVHWLFRGEDPLALQ